MENGNKLLASGKKLLSTARVLLFCFVFGLSALLITLLFCGDYATLYLALSGHYGFVNFLVGVFEFLIIMGSGAAPLLFFRYDFHRSWAALCEYCSE